MHRFLLILGMWLPTVFAECTTQDPPEAPSHRDKAPQQHNDKLAIVETRPVLKEGAIEISRRESTRYGPTEAKLVRVWEYNRDTTKSEWLQEHYDCKRVVYFQISDTPYSLILIDGAVTPLVSVAGPWELWRIDGLENVCQAVDVVRVIEKKVTLIAGGGDMRSIMTFDFTHGLAITYTEEYDGF